MPGFRGRAAGADGATPFDRLIDDGAGNFYGATYLGGTGCSRCGTVFKIAPDGTETLLHTFAKREEPVAGVIMDNKGTLYGTTNKGGAHGVGSVFKVKD